MFLKLQLKLVKIEPKFINSDNSSISNHKSSKNPQFSNTPKNKKKINTTQFPTGFITSNIIIETSSLQDKHLFNYFGENDIS